MSGNTLPLFPLTPNFKSSTSATAVTTPQLSGVGSAVLGFTAGANGSRVDSITIKANATSTAGMIRFWIYTGSGNALLILEVLVAATTGSGTVAEFSSEQLPVNWVLGIGQTVYWAPNNAESFAVHIRGGDY
jgi:hypothetical protein